MRVIKRSVRSHPRVSLILADWGVRESFMSETCPRFVTMQSQLHVPPQITSYRSRKLSVVSQTAR